MSITSEQKSTKGPMFCAPPFINVLNLYLLSSFCISGAIYAFLGSLGSLSGLTGSVLYNTIYPLTLAYWPGFCFILGVIISIIPITLTW